MQDLNDVYLQFAELISDINDAEVELYNKKRLIDDLKKNLTSQESDGSYAIDVTAHAFKQISERIEALARENNTIYMDVLQPECPSKSLLIPSNLKSFLYTTLAVAHKDGHLSKEKSKNGSGYEYHYQIDITKWSGEKTLEFVAICENNIIKTGYFNWMT